MCGGQLGVMYGGSGDFQRDNEEGGVLCANEGNLLAVVNNIVPPKSHGDTAGGGEDGERRGVAGDLSGGGGEEVGHGTFSLVICTQVSRVTVYIWTQLLMLID